MTLIRNSAVIVFLRSICFATIAGAAPVQQIEIEGKVVCLSVKTARNLGLVAAEGEASPKERSIVSRTLANKIFQSGGENSVSNPRVTTKSGQSCVVQIIRELRYPTEFDGKQKDILTPSEFETQNLGLTAELLPNARKDGRIDMELVVDLSYLDGWIGFHEGKVCPTEENGAPPHGGFSQPVVGRAKLQSKVNLRSGETMLLGGIPALHPSQILVGGGPNPLETWKTPNFSEPMVQFYLLTATITDPEKVAPTELVSAPSPEQKVNSSTSKQPYAIQTGRPGFVASPYAPTQGYIDVRGFPRGTEVKDPYTGKVFLVP